MKLLIWLFPLPFAAWANRQRCNVSINNNPSGYWSVRIGRDYCGAGSRSLRRAMWNAYQKTREDPGFHLRYPRQWKKIVVVDDDAPLEWYAK